MRQILLAALFLLLAIPHGSLVAQQGTQTAAERSFSTLFPRQARPMLSGKPTPPSAAFFTIDPASFTLLGSADRGTIRIENFPLGNGSTAALALRRFDVLSRDGAIVAAGDNGEQAVGLPEGIFLTGSVPAIPGSFVYLALFREYGSGYIELPSDGGTVRRYTVAPLALADGMASTMVIYDEAEALRMAGIGKEDGWHCSAEELPEYAPSVDQVFKSYNRNAKKSRQMQSNTLLAAQIAIDCDSAYYVAHGRNLSRAANYALTVAGAASAIYQRDQNIILQVPYLRIWTGRDPYPGTSTATLLGQFRNYWNTNMTSVRRMVAHLFSTNSIGGGVAYLNTLCSSSLIGYGYGVIGLNNNITYPTTAYVWDTDVAAHELGHNFGSPHTHSCVWEPAIDSCYTAEGGCFTGTKPRTGTVMSYCHLTPFGTELRFHSRTSDLIRSNAEAAACVGALENSADNDVAVAAISIPSPGGSYRASSPFMPSATVRNAGTSPQTSLAVTMILHDSIGRAIYSSSRTIASLAPGGIASVDFAPVSISTIARYSATVTVTLASDSFTINNVMTSPFEITASTSGAISLLAPNTATVLRPGTTIPISWNVSGAISALRIDFSPDDGASWTTVATNLDPAPASFNWTVPAVGTARGRLRISDRDNSATADLNDFPFAIDLFRITAPSEGERWSSGTSRTIAWSTFNASAVRIEYSSDNGSTWSTITSSAPNTGRYDWTLPPLQIPAAIIRISDANGLLGAATSGTFTVLGADPPSGLVAMPSDGAVDLSWNAPASAGITGYTIYRGTSPQQLAPIATVEGSRSSYTDRTAANCTSYLYAVTALAGTSESMMSEMATARPEGARTLALATPAPGEILAAGSAKELIWSSTGCIGSVDLSYSADGGMHWNVIGTELANNGRFTWTVPNVSSATVVLKISDRQSPSVSGESPQFRICDIPATIQITGETLICEGGETTLSAPAGFGSYRWSTGETTRTIAVATAGSYSVTVSDAGGCSVSSAETIVQVSPKPRPAITASGPTAFHAGAGVTLSATAGFTSYRWSNGATTREITVTEAGSYSVTATNANGCTGASAGMTVKIIPHTQPTVSASGATTFCQGENVTLAAAEGYAAYRWSNGATTRSIEVWESGSYSVTTTDAAGETGTSEAIDVLVHATPDRPVIERKPGTDSLFCTAGNGGAVEGRVIWERNGQPVAGAAGQVYLATSDGIYRATVIDGNGCIVVSDPFTFSKDLSAEVPVAGERVLAVHPNPSHGRFIVDLNLLRPAPVSIIMVDMMGNEVLRIEEPAASGSYRKAIDATAIPAGAYVIELRAGPRSWRQKVLKQ